MRILIVEDDDGVAGFMKQALSETGFAVDVADNGLAGLQAAQTSEFDLILLDVLLPGLGGFEVCRRLRSAGVAAPVLMITALDMVDQKVTGLDSGADDYLCKPFQVAELLARIRALLRRGSSATAAVRVADLSLDPASRSVSRNGVEIQLSSTEYVLLDYLVRNVGRVLTRAMILDHVWKYDFDGNDNVLDVYISYLRRKIDRDHDVKLIQTVRGIGYRVVAP